MKTNIGFFFGGRSTEHEISVISACQAMAAADNQKYDVTPIYITKDGRWFTGDALKEVKNYRDLSGLLKKCTQIYMEPVYGDYNLYRRERKMFGSPIVTRLDVAIPVLHGSNGEDGVFQGVLETIGLPFAGCDVLASANGMDKITMKMILKSCDIPVVDYVWFTEKEWFAKRDEIIDKIEKNIGYPVIVKPANLGSSVGIGEGKDHDSLIAHVEDAMRYSSRIIVEDMVENLKEINCSVLGDCDDYQPSVCEEAFRTVDILSYEDKYMGGTKTDKGMAASSRKCPADLAPEVTEKIQFLATETFRVLGCHGVSRVDMMINGNTGDIYVNEINTIPGSLSYYLWEASGIPFKAFIDRLVGLALKRKREMDRKIFTYDHNIFAIGGGTKGGLKGGIKK